jgi:hypothetical protein
MKHEFPKKYDRRTEVKYNYKTQWTTKTIIKFIYLLDERLSKCKRGKIDPRVHLAN